MKKGQGHKMTSIIFLMFMVVMVKGVQYIKNSDFSSFTSIADISFWHVINYGTVNLN